MIQATELRKGHVIQYEGDLWLVLDTLHVTPGNWRGFVKARLRNLKTGNSKEQRFSSVEKLEDVFVEQKEVEYSYSDGSNYVFIDPATYDQLMLNKSLIAEEDAKWFTDGMKLTVNLFDSQPIGITLPSVIEIKVVQTEPYLKGATVSNVDKPATLENGITIKVPPFIEQGEAIRINPQELKYLERVSKK